MLTTRELFTLHLHYFGRGSDDLLAAIDAAATATGDQREAALQHLGELQARHRVGAGEKLRGACALRPWL